MRMKFIRFFPLLVTVLLFGATEVYAQTATVVTHSGQRLRGQILSMNAGTGAYNGGYNNGGYESVGDAVVVRTNGRDRRIPVEDVAFIDFAGNGTAPQRELTRANQTFDGLVVLRDGRTMEGRLVDFQGSNGYSNGYQVNNNQAVISGQFGERRIPLNQVARVYFGGNVTANNQNQPYYDRNQNVYGNYNDGQYRQYGGYNQPAYGNQPSYGTGRTVTIPTNQTWTNAGIDVRRGEVIHFRASGNVSLSHNQGDYGTPAGANDGRLAGNSPLPGVTGGMLIGRVGNSQPFAIGAESDVTMPTNGRLYLGVNDDYVGDNSGNFVVEIVVR